jgi:anaerobic selenocysteine-containing dehydrogenase
VKLKVPKAAGGTADGALRLGTFRPLWASKEVEVSPALRFLVPRQVVELSPNDAQRLGISPGAEVEVASNGHKVQGAAVVRAAVPAGSVFIAEGVPDGSGNMLTEPVVVVRPTGRYVEEPVLVPAAAGELAEDAAVASPQGDEEGVGQALGEDTRAAADQDPYDRHAAQIREGDQTAETPPKPSRRGRGRKKDSGPDKATGGGA